MANGTLLPHAPQGRDMITIDPDRCGATGRLDFRSRGVGMHAPKLRRRADLAIDVKSLPLTGLSPRILLLGDSLFNRRVGLKVKERLQLFGMTPVFIGTMPGADTEIATSTEAPSASAARVGHGAI